MIKENVILRYSTFDESEKIRFLLATSHGLTIFTRIFYETGRDWSSHPKQLMGANELQHHLSAEALHHFDSNEKRYPDEVLIGILFDKASHYGIVAELETSLSRAMTNTSESRSN